MSKNIAGLGLGLILLGISNVAQAQFVGRCVHEWLSPRDAWGRNEWAVKCGYLTAEQAEEMKYRIWFISFEGACAQYPDVPPGSQCKRYVPISKSEACIPDLRPSGICSVG